MRNVPGLEDCTLFESQAIVEWLDEAPFPAEVFKAGATPTPLYPIDFSERLDAKLWQYWELSMAEVSFF